MRRAISIPELRPLAESIWRTALDAARPGTCLSAAIRIGGAGFAVGRTEIPLRGRLVVVGAGKAAASMAQEVERIFGDRIRAGRVITKYGHGLRTARIEVLEAGHPVPDEAGAAAVERMRELLGGLASEDVVLCLISGGGSALMPAPAPGVTLEAKQEVTSSLLRAGATIREINAVRKHLSAIKGGGLARLAAPARVVSLIVSDVIGDPLDTIASGPTVPDTSTFADALHVIRKYGLRVPPAVGARLEAGVRGEIPENPQAGDPLFARVMNHIVANNRLLVDSAADRARALGFHTLVLASEVEGEARDVGRLFASIAREIPRGGSLPPPACVLAAGETTVTIHGPGRGGRNLEMALAWALAMSGDMHPACFASIASDGTDGPTDSAGGLVDPGTVRRAADLGLDALRSLEANDSYSLLEAVGDSVRTGPTGTNLMDLQILLVG